MKKNYKIHPQRLEYFERQFSVDFYSIPENSEDLKNAILAKIHENKKVKIELEVLDRMPATQEDMKSQDEYYRAVYAREAIKVETQDYIEYLEYRLDQITPVKSTHYRELKERYAIMRHLGFFDTPYWKGLANEKDRDKLLAEILQCDLDNAKKIRSPRPIPKYKLTEEEEKDIHDMIKSMQKRGL